MSREQRLHAVEMRARLVVEVRRHQRRGGDQLAQLRILAVEDAQRIALEPPQAVLVEPLAMRGEVLDERLLVARARFERAERVQLERRARDTELLPQARRQSDELGVDLGLGVSERLDAELMKLAVPALLRFLAAEHRAAAPELLLLIVQQAVAQAARTTPAVASGRNVILSPLRSSNVIHLFLDDVGELADRAAEELRAFEHGQAHALIAVAANNAAAAARHGPRAALRRARRRSYRGPVGSARPRCAHSSTTSTLNRE